MAEKIQAPSKRDAYLARLREKHPDMEFADDEALYGQAMSDYDDYENQVDLSKRIQRPCRKCFQRVRWQRPFWQIFTEARTRSFRW